ncbi:MAG TPA: hypothetical protein VNN10_00575 [Dehalococcoidia bacterium]|nr:hypothetical protein [Dehalococcoidia bacterium]
MQRTQLRLNITPGGGTATEPADDGEARLGRIEQELRHLLGLPAWSNLRGDDVIALTLALDAHSRVRVNDLFVEMREILDALVGHSGPA